MAELERTNDGSSGMDSILMRFSGLDSKPTDCYTTSSESENSLSLIYTTLPRILQRRLPRIRSLRYAASIYASPKAHLRSWSTSSAVSTHSESPPPSYHTRLSTSESSADEGEDDENASDDELPDFFTSAPSSRPSTSGSATPAPNHQSFKRHGDLNTPTIGNRSGHHGLALLNLAMRSQSTSATDDPLNRRLYIDGISYILRGLPEDLSPEETLVLRAATPAVLLPEPQEPTTDQRQLVHQQPPHPNHPPTLLHRTTSTLTFYTLVLLTFLLPYLQTLFTALYALDARHKISARFLTQTTLLLRLVAAQAIAVMALAWGANDGALRHACRDFGVWVLRDVCGGLDEGVGRAVQGLRLEEKEREAR